MSERTKAAVIGLGVGMAHARGYLACADAELYAVCDADPARLKERGDQLNIPERLRFTRIDDLLALPELEVVSIGLPNNLHAPAAIQAFEAGKHVLCEKPLAASAEQAAQMVAASKKTGRMLMVCFNYRFREDTRWLKRLVQEGQFGQVYMAKAGWLRCAGIPGRGWFARKALSGGGPLIDLGVHVLDLSLWLMGYPKVVSVSGSTYAEFGPRGRKVWGSRSVEPNADYDVEDLAAGFVRFADGRSLLLETNWATHTKPGKDDYFVTLYGSEGGSELYVANYTNKNTVTFYQEISGEPVVVKPDITVSGGHELAVAHFIECVRTNTPPEASGEDGLELMRLISALYESARNGREIHLD